MSVIYSFSKLIRLKHHRNFLQFCSKMNIVPLGLQIRKKFSCHGPVLEGFEERWKSAVTTAEKQLLTLLIL